MYVWLAGYSNSYSEYNEKVQGLSECLMRIIVDGLDVDPAYFETFSKHAGGLLRWNFYPACPEPQKTLGLKPHTDFNLLTVLHQGDVGGLQIEKDGKWIPVRPRPGALAVNIGDTLQVRSSSSLNSFSVAVLRTENPLAHGRLSLSRYHRTLLR